MLSDDCSQALPALPPMRDKLPTLPCDLREFAQIQTGPSSWSADPPIDDELTFDECTMEAGELLGVRPSDVPEISFDDAARHRDSLDRRESFILALLEQCDDVQTLLDKAGLPEAETLEALCALCARGVVALISREMGWGQRE